jgi:hypothetical protein
MHSVQVAGWNYGDTGGQQQRLVDFARPAIDRVPISEEDSVRVLVGDTTDGEFVRCEYIQCVFHVNRVIWWPAVSRRLAVMMKQAHQHIMIVLAHCSRLTSACARTHTCAYAFSDETLFSLGTVTPRVKLLAAKDSLLLAGSATPPRSRGPLMRAKDSIIIKQVHAYREHVETTVVNTNNTYETADTTFKYTDVAEVSSSDTESTPSQSPIRRLV